MTRPKIYTYVTGSIAMRVFVYGFTALNLWEDLQARGSEALTVIMLLMSAACAHEAKALKAYRTWKWEWDAMAGIAPPLTIFQRWPWLATVVHNALWFGVIVVLVTILPSPLNVIVERVFIFVWTIMFARWVGQKLRIAWRNRKRNKAPKDCFVTVVPAGAGTLARLSGRARCAAGI